MEENKKSTANVRTIKPRNHGREGILMSVKEMGDLLGLKKTERYRLMHMGLFETRVFLGKMMIVRESFEKWYAGQVWYRKITGEEPGRDLKEWSYSIQDIADMFELHPSTVYALLAREQIKTVKVEHGIRVPKDTCEQWYAGQDRYIKIGPLPEWGKTVSNMTKGRKEKECCESGEFIAVEEAMRISGFSRTTLSNWIRNGHFRTQKAGRALRIKRSDFEEWLKQMNTDREGEITWHP